MRITILGQTPAQKNDKRMAVNSRTGKHFPMTGKLTKAWKESAAAQLLQWKGRAERKVTVTYFFWVKNDVARDTDNMIASVNDALVSAGLLKGDNWQLLRIGAADADIDRDNPRAELWIEEDA